MSTAVVAYAHMLDDSEIVVLTEFDAIEKIFGTIMERFTASEEPCLCTGLDLEWKPKVVYGQWHKPVSGADIMTVVSVSQAATAATPKATPKEKEKENAVSMLQITLSTAATGSGSAASGCDNNSPGQPKAKTTYLIRMLHAFDRSRCSWVHPNESAIAAGDATLTAAASYQSCALFRFLSDPRVLKFGVGVSGDRRRLHADFGVLMQGTVELGKFLQKVPLYRLQQSAVTDAASGGLAKTSSEEVESERDGSEQPAGGRVQLIISPASSLAHIVAAVLGAKIPKDKAIQCGDWEAESLSQEQLLYAASDSYHALLVCEAVLTEACSRHGGAGSGSGMSGSSGHENSVCSVAPSPASVARRLAAGLVDSGVVRALVNNAASATAMNKLQPTSTSAAATTAVTSGASAVGAGGDAGRKQIVNKKVCRLRAARSPIYESCAMIGHDGQFLSYCDGKRIAWYLKKDLADEVDAETIAWYVEQKIVDASVLTASGRMVQLRFEAKGTGNRDDSYKRQKLQNKCVVCGHVQDTVPPKLPPMAGSTHTFTDNSAPVGAPDPSDALQLLHHHVVPKAYRRVFPSVMVSKNNHDILPICKTCKAEVAVIYANKMQILEMTYVSQEERDALSAARRLANRPGPLTLNLSKVQTLCGSLLQTTDFMKKVKVDNPDGTRKVLSVPVGPQKTMEIKFQMMKSLHVTCDKLVVEEGSAQDPALVWLRDEGKSLLPDQPEKIRVFLTRFEELAAKKVADRERARRAVEQAAADENDEENDDDDDDEEEEEERRGCGNACRPAALAATAGCPLGTVEGLVVASFLHPLSLSDDIASFAPRLREFESMWRRFFLDTVCPRHMPMHWSVDYKHVHNQDPSSY